MIDKFIIEVECQIGNTYLLFTITYYFPKIAGWDLVKSE